MRGGDFVEWIKWAVYIVLAIPVAIYVVYSAVQLVLSALALVMGLVMGFMPGKRK